MDNVGIVFNDLVAAVAFFVELGLELEGETTVEGSSVDRLVGLDNVRTDIALMRTPDGHSRRIMFAVDDIEDVVARLRARGAQLVGELVQYGDKYRVCYVRGPEDILVALAEQIR
jgi:catechol 2,3-dioxygenase-like lactoylglutathione lyase family enzyme